MEVGKGGRVARLTSDGQSCDPVGGLLYEQTKLGSDVCDVSLLYAGMEQKVHKCVLMTSHYFHALYESGLLENDNGKVTISVGSPAAIQAAVKFLYLRQVEVSLKNVEELMEVADYLQIAQMKAQCMEFLASVPVGPDNCVTLCMIGSQYENEELYQLGYDYLIAHLPEVLQHDPVLSLGVESVLGILRDNSLLYASAEDLFAFLVRWVEYDLDKRLPHFPELFDSLHLERFTEEGYYKFVSCHVLVNMFPQCRDRVSKFSTKLEAGNARLTTGEKLVFLMAGHEAEPHMLLTDGGRCLEAVGTRRLLGFLAWEKRWIELAPVPVKASRRALLTGLTRTIYATESRQLLASENMQQLYRYDIAQKKWSEVRALIPYYEKSKSFQVVSLEQCRGRIYAITTSLSSGLGHAVNLYLLEEGQVDEMVWQKELVPCGVFPASSSVNAVVVGDRYLCVAVQKRDETDGEMTCLVYDFETGEVQNCSKGSLPLLMMFGRDGEVVLAEPGVGYAKVLNVESKTWRVEHHLGIPELPETVSRSEYNYFYEDDKLFVFGGRASEGKTYLRSSLMYEFKGSNWESVGVSPCRVVNTSASVVQLSCEALRCHIDCPHCKFTGLKQGTEYEILPPLSPSLNRREEVEEGWLSEAETRDSDEEEEDDDNGHGRLDLVQLDVRNGPVG